MTLNGYYFYYYLYSIILNTIPNLTIALFLIVVNVSLPKSNFVFNDASDLPHNKQSLI